jgi:hypothetical protein|tara:strand:- start:94 stop:303 length:210 start_codon:yes stop_codon:yes gene_type:complete
MKCYKEKMINNTIKRLEAKAEGHMLNAEIILGNHVAVADHPDMMGTLDKELTAMAEAHGQLEMLLKYFK